MPRRDYYDDDDDRPRPRSRRRYEDDDDDDYDPRPRRRSQSSSAAPIIIVGAIVGLLVLVVGGGAVAYFAFRSKPVPQQPPPQFVNFNPPPMAMNPVAPMPPGGPGMPPGGGIPEMPIAPPGGPGLPAAGGNQATISKLRLGGFGIKQSLEFDYTFPGGRPFGGADIVAVIKEPGQTDVSVARLHFLDQQGSITIDTFGGLGRGFPRGTTVYLGRQALGAFRGTPTPISNTLTLQ